MKKLFILLLSLTVLLAFNISSFAYFDSVGYLDGKSYLPDVKFTFLNTQQGMVNYSENLSVYCSDLLVEVIDNDLFESGEYVLSENSLNILSQGDGEGADVFLDQNFVLYKILPDDLGERYDYMLSREYIYDEYCREYYMHINSPILKLSPELDDVRFYFQNNQGVRCFGSITTYTATEDGYSIDEIPFDYRLTSGTDFYFGDVVSLDYESFDLAEIYLSFLWQPVIENGKILSSYQRIHIDIPLTLDFNDYWTFRGTQPLIYDDLVVNVQSINDFNFLEWLANSVQSFFSVTLFRIGSVPVSVGVCMLVPLSLSILIGFLKKFSGG